MQQSITIGRGMKSVFAGSRQQQLLFSKDLQRISMTTCGRPFTRELDKKIYISENGSNNLWTLAGNDPHKPNTQPALPRQWCRPVYIAASVWGGSKSVQSDYGPSNWIIISREQQELDFSWSGPIPSTCHYTGCPINNSCSTLGQKHDSQQQPFCNFCHY